MKQTQNKMKLFLYICLGLIILNACTFEEEIIKQNGYQEKMKLESKKFSELLKLPAFSNAYRRVINKKVTISNDFEARAALEDQYGFTIVEGKDVKIITDVDGTIFYSMLIERAVKENLKFENLVIKVVDEEVFAYILKRELYEKAIYVESNDSFNLNVKDVKLTELNVSSSTITSRFYIVKTWIPHCVLHSSNALCCFGNPQNDNWTTDCGHYEYILTSSFDGDEDGTPVGTGTPTGDGIGTTGTGQEGGGGVTNNNNNPPPSNGENPNEIPIPNNTPPIKNVIIPSDEVVEPNEDQCEKLKDLIKPYPNPNINPFKNALIYNDDAVESKNYEVGHLLRLNGNYQLAINQLDPPATANCNELKLGLLLNPYLFGFFHSHPANCGDHGVGEIFSHADIASFCKIVKNHNFGNSTYPNGTSVNPDNFIATVSSFYGTFAIKINDFETFRNIALDILSSKKKYKKFEEDYNEGVPHMFENEDRKKIGLLKTLNSLFNNSLSVYKAQPDFTGWDKLELTDNNTKIKETPCN